MAGTMLNQGASNGASDAFRVAISHSFDSLASQIAAHVALVGVVCHLPRKEPLILS